MNALPLEQVSVEDFQTTVYDYQSEQVRFSHIHPMESSIRLLNFGQRSYHSKLIMQIDDQDYELDLHRKKTLKNFIGFEGDTYELVIPEELHQDAQLKKMFKGKKVIPLTINQDATQLRIEDHQSNFQFVFEQEL